MNDLYEVYVGECLKRVLVSSAYKLDLQHKDKRLLVNIHSGRENISLKPDFVVSSWEDNEERYDQK
ncbi:5-methylcytosine restriction system specificity protein McrC [Anaerobacillus alkalilacustris]|uniref:5-methylcytosine restriction system specificity protein McrC n=1 Tax=Anaerobacillus alkalilacustris TaxID=393763 RepID=UPI003CCC1C8D